MLAGQRITSRRQGLPGALLPVVLLVLTGKVLHPLRGTPAYAVRRVLKTTKVATACRLGRSQWFSAMLALLVATKVAADIWSRT